MIIDIFAEKHTMRALWPYGEGKVCSQRKPAMGGPRLFMRMSIRRFASAIAAAGAVLAAVGLRGPKPGTSKSGGESRARQTFPPCPTYTGGPRRKVSSSKSSRPGTGRLAESSKGRRRKVAFKRIVKKEPKYQSAYPFRGVLKLGVAGIRLRPGRGGPDAGRQGEEAGRARKTPAAAEPQRPTRRSPSWASRLAKPPPPSRRPSAKIVTYNRLYFDFNHNGDLTDDKVVEAASRIQAIRWATPRRNRISVPVSADRRHDRRRRDQAGLFLLPRRDMPCSSPNNCSYVSVSLSCGRLPRRRHHPGRASGTTSSCWTSTATGVSTTRCKIAENIHMAQRATLSRAGRHAVDRSQAEPTDFDSPYDRRPAITATTSPRWSPSTAAATI